MEKEKSFDKFSTELGSSELISNPEDLDKDDDLKKEKIGCLIAFVILSVGLEFFYRDKLFYKSIEFEKNWQSSGGSFSKGFFKCITEFGGEYALVGLVIITFYCFSLNKSFTFLLGVIICNYFVSTAKLWYASPRPYWEDREVTVIYGCDKGFGNPSGHSTISVFSYLALWHYLTELKIFNSLVRKIFLLIFFILIIISIILSRLFLGLHSINQVIYGSTLGIAAYLLLLVIIQMHIFSTKKYKSLFMEKRNIATFSGVFITMFFILLFSYLLKNDSEDEKKYGKNIDNQSECKNVKKYRMMKQDGFYGGLTLFCLVGAYYGQCFFWYMIEKKGYNEKKEKAIIKWVRNREHVFKNLKNLGMATAFVLMSFIPCIMYLAIGGENISLALIFIFKTSIPFLLTLFLVYGGSFYLLINYGLGNKKIYDEISDIEASEKLV